MRHHLARVAWCRVDASREEAVLEPVEHLPDRDVMDATWPAVGPGFFPARLRSVIHRSGEIVHPVHKPFPRLTEVFPWCLKRVGVKGKQHLKISYLLRSELERRDCSRQGDSSLHVMTPVTATVVLCPVAPTRRTLTHALAIKARDFAAFSSSPCLAAPAAPAVAVVVVVAPSPGLVPVVVRVVVIIRPPGTAPVTIIFGSSATVVAVVDALWLAALTSAWWRRVVREVLEGSRWYRVPVGHAEVPLRKAPLGGRACLVAIEVYRHRRVVVDLLQVDVDAEFGAMLPVCRRSVGHQDLLWFGSPRRAGKG
jgi:hypothetical protein